MRLKPRFIILLTVVIAFASLALWKLPPFWGQFMPRSQCSGFLSGRLFIEHMEVKLPELWCWASSTSEVLKWYRLPHSEACEIYDLVNAEYSTTTCQDKVDPSFPCNDPSKPETCWFNKPNNNNGGDAAEAARTYQAVYPLISVTERQDKAFDFYQIREKICPADGSLGSPFIFVYKQSEEFDHDVVVHGYSLINLENTPEQIWGRYLYVHDPNNEWDPRVIDYEAYKSDLWVEDVLIWGVPPGWLKTLF
jgi:hypothetical protein